MEHPQGYLHNKLDVKVLILFILARIDTPLTGQELFEVGYQDDSLNYFTFAESLPELVASGHVSEQEGRYAITDLGRRQGAQVEDSLAVPVVTKVAAAITRKQTELLRDSFITTQVSQDENGYWIATLLYRDDGMPMMTLSLMAPNQALAAEMARRLRLRADALYKSNLDAAIGQDS